MGIEKKMVDRPKLISHFMWDWNLCSNRQFTQAIFHGSSDDCLDILNATRTNRLYVHAFAIGKTFDFWNHFVSIFGNVSIRCTNGIERIRFACRLNRHFIYNHKSAYGAFGPKHSSPEHPLNNEILLAFTLPPN